MIEWFIIIGAVSLCIWLYKYDSQESITNDTVCVKGTCCHKKEPVEIDLKNLK